MRAFLFGHHGFAPAREWRFLSSYPVCNTQHLSRVACTASAQSASAMPFAFSPKSILSTLSPPQSPRRPTCQARYSSNVATEEGHRRRLSEFWTPSIASRRIQSVEDVSSSHVLARCGFYTQTSPGIFHFLPLGLRVQQKLEGLIDKHMGGLGASKLSLSTLSMPNLWITTNRLEDKKKEQFSLRDRHDTELLLAPTHEEEITYLAASLVKSYKELPLRLYQISRKYRDEIRPREGLLRAREFIMKDLYTFDWTEELAKRTYEEVRSAYTAFFKDLKLDCLVAEASSGSIGGNVSHEYHLPSSNGEDEVVSCDSCNYTASAELAERREFEKMSTVRMSKDQMSSLVQIVSYTGTADIPVQRIVYTTSDFNTLVIGIMPVRKDQTGKVFIKPHVLKEYSIDMNIEYPIQSFLEHVKQRQGSTSTEPNPRVICVLDRNVICDGFNPDMVTIGDLTILAEVQRSGLDLAAIQDGERCPMTNCASGRLGIQKCVELGHTFHLGTRYSAPLGFTVHGPGAHAQKAEPTDPQVGENNKIITVQMGCHGIGISRLIAAVAHVSKDKKGLNWPRAMAPFEVVIIASQGHEEQANEVYDVLRRGKQSIDCIIDDREHGFGYKMNDAELIGYPVVVRVGRGWSEGTRKCMIQCRRPEPLQEDVPFTHLKPRILEILDRL